MRHGSGRVLLKLENLHHTGSFKERGALNRLLQLTPEERAKGVITASAGNHAQGLAFHAERLDIATTVVMPTQTPLIKVSRTEEHGATIVLHGRDYDSAHAHARELAKRQDSCFVHGYDDLAVMAGQGVIGLELAEQCPDLSTVVVPVGGGGLLAGIVVALRALRPEVRVIGVESAQLNSMAQALQRGGPWKLPHANTLADGIAVRQAGKLCHQLCIEHNAELCAVDDDAIARATLHLLEVEKVVAEGAGATALAALQTGLIPESDGDTALIVSGGNIDVTLLSRIINRGLVQSGRLCRVCLNVVDRPGALAGPLALLGELRANVLEVQHQRAFSPTPMGTVEVRIVLETRGARHIDELLTVLSEGGYPAKLESPPES